MMITRCELDEDVGLAGLDFVELQRCHIAPQAERVVDGSTNLVVAEIRREIENSDRIIQHARIM